MQEYQLYKTDVHLLWFILDQAVLFLYFGAVARDKQASVLCNDIV